ncbi:hypothetical protein [Amycolatopsis mediterranei]|uniref:hypothetical protein n=1 Tax=Amycolatopsis mediterranei TaxID=33910 RepID=UPI00114C9CA9|nr:hypothetical protein [Amycolatopsis mediterranei]
MPERPSDFFTDVSASMRATARRSSLPGGGFENGSSSTGTRLNGDRDVRLVTDPCKPLCRMGNTYQRELKYLKDKGYTWQWIDDYWQVFRGRP